MKNIFLKSNLPLIDEAVHTATDACKMYDLYHKMRCEEGLNRHIASEIVLLERAAALGNRAAMCELARHYFFDYGTDHIPYAMTWWRRANLFGVEPALSEYREKREEFLHRASEYGERFSYFANLLMRCAMLTEIHLFDLGLVDWSHLTNEERMERINTLSAAVAPLLMIDAPEMKAVANLTYTDKGEVRRAQGMAHYEGWIDLDLDMLADRERTIAVIFHELGHFVCFRAMAGNEDARRVMEAYGLSEGRVNSWKHGEMGIEVPTSEEDPDTLSYGVYTNWAVLFADPRA